MTDLFEDFLTFLYDAILNDEILLKALEVALSLLGADSIHLFALQQDTGLQALAFAPCVRPRVQSKYMEEYKRLIRSDSALKHSSPNRLMMREARAPFFALSTEQELAAGAPPIHRVMGANVGTKSMPIWFGIGNQHPDALFSPKQQKVLAQMLPHVSRCLRLHSQCTATQHSLEQLSSLLDTADYSLLLVSAKQLEFANQQAQEVLSGGFLRLDQARLMCRDPAAQRQLLQAQSDALVSGNGTAVLRDEEAQLTYFLSVSRYNSGPTNHPRSQPDTLLYKISQPHSDRAAPHAVTIAFCAANNLTQAEAGVLEAVLTNKSLSSWAEERDVRVDTLRKQLKTAMKKIHSQSQKDLFQQFERFRAVVESDLPQTSSTAPQRRKSRARRLR